MTTPYEQLDRWVDAHFAEEVRFLQALVENWNEANAVVRQSDGKLLIGGWVYPTAGSNGDFAAIRLLPNGAPAKRSHVIAVLAIFP